MNVNFASRVSSLLMALALMAPSQNPAATKVVVFAPWSASGLRHGFTVTAKLNGNCWSRSLATNRTDAWRCMSGNEIYDPCFAGSPQKNVVACAQVPFSNSVVIVRNGKPVDGRPSWIARSTRPKGEPWALRLDDGDTCVFETGATDVIAGKRMNYACAKAGWIVGLVNRSRTNWTAQSVASPSDKQLKVVRIASALF